MYTVIARKYRPQSFSEVVNQEHIKQTLRNAIAQQRIAHGYIFAGQRGTGKTTMARLLAKALNCAKGPAADPDLTCPSCKEIAAGNSVDVIEIDAASNRGIDDIRGLRENTRYAPSRDRYKFFIIDEAHQLTKEAWNALLKTLEEPPPHVIFVLCTTEAHSIPGTIASRCQTFAFHNLGFEETVKQLQHICAAEGIEASEEALAVMTQAAEGSLRDALSTLDQAIACCGSKLEGETVRQLLGVVPSQVLEEVIAAVQESSSERMLALVDNLVREGHNLRNLSVQLCRQFRNLLVVKTAGNSPQLVEASRAERERLTELAAGFSEEDLTRYLQIMLRLHQELHHSPQPRFHTELGLLKLVHAARLAPIEEFIARAEGSGGALPPPPRTAPPTPRSKTQNSAAQPSGGVPPSEELSARVIERVETMGRQMLGVALEKAISWQVANDAVSIGFPAEGGNIHMPGAEDQRLLGRIASDILGRPVSVRATLVAGVAAQPSSVDDGRQNVKAVPQGWNHPEVAEFVRLFPGAVIEEQKRKV